MLQSSSGESGRSENNIAIYLMATGAFSRNVGKLFSELMFVTDKFFSLFIQQPTEKPLKVVLSIRILFAYWIYFLIELEEWQQSFKNSENSTGFLLSRYIAVFQVLVINNKFKLKLVTDNLFSIYAAANWEATESK